MRVGIIVDLASAGENEKRFKELVEMGMNSCQLVCWNRKLLTDENAGAVRKAADKYGVTITAFWCGWEGPVIWDFYGGQETLGLVPEAYRFQRFANLLEGSEFARKIGVGDLVTHVGFLPENPHDPRYTGVIACLKGIAAKCKRNGQRFLFETGQETPVTLLRAIEDTGMDNVGVNLDPANLLMYGKANPVDALEILGKYVMGVHGKDGCYPVDGRFLGQEKPMGEGKVNYPLFIRTLREIGYDGDITIEREIEGEEQKKDIMRAKKFLEELIEEEQSL